MKPKNPLKSRLTLTTLALCGLLAGCGSLNTLHLDFDARQAINPDGGQQALATVVRVYQLKSRAAFDRADYAALLSRDSMVLKADLLSSHDLTLLPGGKIALNMPLDKDAKFVAITALLIDPAIPKNNWRVVIPREQLDKKHPRVLTLENNVLSLQQS